MGIKYGVLYNLRIAKFFPLKCQYGGVAPLDSCYIVEMVLLKHIPNALPVFYGMGVHIFSPSALRNA